jgi:hypothetical protein
LYVSYDGKTTNPAPAGATNSFNLTDFTIPAGTSKTVDVFASLSNDTGTATTSLVAYGYGAASNITITSAQIPGQTLTIGAGTLAVPTIGVDSADSQFVLGGQTYDKQVYYKFVSANGTSNITDMTINSTGSIASIAVGSNTPVSVVGTTTIFSGLTGITIGTDLGGTLVPISIKYNKVGPGQTASSTNAASITLANYKFTSGGTSSSTDVTVGPSNSMIVVSAKPIVTLTIPALNRSITAGQNYKLASITVKADGGTIDLIQLPIKIQTSTGTTISGLNIKINGGTSNGSSTLSATTVGAATSTTILTTFYNGVGYGITGTTVFEIWGSVDAMTTDGFVRTSIASTTQFIWRDTNGNASSTGDYIVPNITNDSVAISYNS